MARHGSIVISEQNCTKSSVGVTIGLEEWRTDVTMLAYHLRAQALLKTKNSQLTSRNARHRNGGVQPKCYRIELDVYMRIFDHDVISLLCREVASVTTWQLHRCERPGAESKAEPGRILLVIRKRWSSFVAKRERESGEVR